MDKNEKTGGFSVDVSVSTGSLRGSGGGSSASSGCTSGSLRVQRAHHDPVAGPNPRLGTEHLNRHAEGLLQRVRWHHSGSCRQGIFSWR